jgi:hypothetical protein
MRGVRDRVEHADYQCATAVGLDNLDLETLAGGERVRTEVRHDAHPVADQPWNLAASLDSQWLTTGREDGRSLTPT